MGNYSKEIIHDDLNFVIRWCSFSHCQICKPREDVLMIVGEEFIFVFFARKMKENLRSFQCAPITNFEKGKKKGSEPDSILNR